MLDHRACPADRGAGCRRAIASARRCPAICAAAPATSRSSRPCSRRAPRTARATSHDRKAPTAISAARSSASRTCACCAVEAQFVDDLHREGMLHAAILRSPSRTAGSARSTRARRARYPACAACLTAQTSQAVDRLVPTHSDCACCRCPDGTVRAARHRAQKVRYVGEPLAVVVADSARARRGRAGGDRGRHRDAAGGRGPPSRRQGRRAAVRSARQQPRDHLQGRERRCGVGECALRAAGEIQRAPP